MSQPRLRPLKDAAKDILVVYGVFCIFAACMGFTVIADHYGLFKASPTPPNDAELVVDVQQGVGEVFGAVEEILERVGEIASSTFEDFANEESK